MTKKTRVQALSRTSAELDSRKRIRRPKMAEMIARDIRKRIVNRAIAEGSHLPSEMALVEEYGVSRATLREGLRILESEGLLDIGPGSHNGPKVCSPTLGVAARHFGVMLQYLGVEMSDVYGARAVIEPMAVKIVAMRRNKKDIAYLRSIISEERAAADDDTATSRHAVRFHEALIEATGNVTLQLIAGILHEVFEQHITAVTIANTNVSPEMSRKVKEVAYRAQDKLLTLMESGDGDAAMEYWQKHFKELTSFMSSDPRFQRVADIL